MQALRIPHSLMHLQFEKSCDVVFVGTLEIWMKQVSVCLFMLGNFFQNSIRNTIRMSNSLDPDQGQHFVGPDQGPNCLQRLSADVVFSLKFKENSLAVEVAGPFTFILGVSFTKISEIYMQLKFCTKVAGSSASISR